MLTDNALHQGFIKFPFDRWWKSCLELVLVSLFRASAFPRNKWTCGWDTPFLLFQGEIPRFVAHNLDWKSFVFGAFLSLLNMNEAKSVFMSTLCTFVCESLCAGLRNMKSFSLCFMIHQHTRGTISLAAILPSKGGTCPTFVQHGTKLHSPDDDDGSLREIQ